MDSSLWILKKVWYHFCENMWAILHSPPPSAAIRIGDGEKELVDRQQAPTPLGKLAALIPTFQKFWTLALINTAQEITVGIYSNY